MLDRVKQPSIKSCRRKACLCLRVKRYRRSSTGPAINSISARAISRGKRAESSLFGGGKRFTSAIKVRNYKSSIFSHRRSEEASEEVNDEWNSLNLFFFYFQNYPVDSTFNSRGISPELSQSLILSNLSNLFTNTSTEGNYFFTTSK